MPAEETAANLRLMRLIDAPYTEAPFYGSRRMTAWLCRAGYPVNRQRVQRLMRTMGLEAIYPRPRLSQGGADHQVYPYLLRGLVPRPAEPDLECRYHLCPHAARVHVPRGHSGLV